MPLLWISLAFTAGIALGDALKPPLLAGLAGGGLCLALLAVRRLRGARWSFEDITQKSIID